MSRVLRISRRAKPMEIALKFVSLCILRCGDGGVEVPRTDGIVRLKYANPFGER